MSDPFLVHCGACLPEREAASKESTKLEREREALREDLDRVTRGAWSKELARLSAVNLALREAAVKVTCKRCNGVAIVRDTDTNMGAPCPDCADLRALLAYAGALAAQLAEAQHDANQAHGVAQALERQLAAELDAKRLDWIERHLFEGKWDGTIGRPKSWHMAGPYRHTLQLMRGDTFREAIDAALERT